MCEFMDSQDSVFSYEIVMSALSQEVQPLGVKGITAGSMARGSVGLYRPQAGNAPISSRRPPTNRITIPAGGSGGCYPVFDKIRELAENRQLLTLGTGFTDDGRDMSLGIQA